MASTVWRGGTDNNSWGSAANWSDGIPLSGDEGYLMGPVTLTMTGIQIDGVVINANSAPGGTVNVTMTNSTLGAGSTFYTGGYGAPISIGMVGQDTLAGTLYAWNSRVNVGIAGYSGLTNTGTIIAQGNENTPFIQIATALRSTFHNQGGIYAATGGTVELTDPGGATRDGSPLPLLSANENLIDAQGGGTVLLHGMLQNSRLVLAESGGRVVVGSGVIQSAGAVIEAKDGGTIQDDGRISGGIVKLDSHMLGAPSRMTFGLFDQQSGTSFAAHFLAAGLVLEGRAELTFPGGVTALDFDKKTNTLTVFERLGQNPHLQAAALHLVGNYTRGEFAVTPDHTGVAFNDHTVA
jgi:hypothetical protein